MISHYDYFIIGFYLVFVLAIGAVFRRTSKDTSDYFRAGGAMPWWITGTSAWIASFSAWTFVGAAGMVYETGTLVLCLYYSAVIGLTIVYFWTSTRFRRMRVISWMEAVGLRYGGFSEQFYTWVKLPLLLFLSGLGLNSIGVFMSTVFHVDIGSTLLVLGVVVTLVACAGGAWAVLASDFVQMFLVMTITIVAAILTLNLPQIGGIHGLIEKVPVPLSPMHWGSLAQPFTLVLWALAISWMQIANSNNMENSVMYLMSKSDRDVRRMVLIPLIGSIIGPMIWLIPSLAATILHPNLAAEFPNLKQPHEAAFVAVCMQVMPRGLIGLMLCAMLGATITAMDASLNKGVSIFVRSFYLPMIDPKCPEKKLLVIGKIGTLVFGAIVVACALLVNKWRTANLFVLVNQVAGSLTIPLALPLFFGLFYKRTPAWSAWSTGLVGFVVSYLINFPLKARLLGIFGPLTGLEKNNLMLALAVFGTLIACGGWFFFTSLFYNRSPPEHHERVEKFFANLRTPIDAQKEGIKNFDQVIYKLIGGLCLVYGAFILLLFFIPNSFGGRMCFVFVGGVIFTVGAVLFWISKKLQRQQEQMNALKDKTRVAE